MSNATRVRVKILKGVIINGKPYVPAKEGQDPKVVAVAIKTAKMLEHFGNVEILGDASGTDTDAGGAVGGLVFASPEAEKAFNDAGLSEDDVFGTGKDGKVTAKDVQDAVDELYGTTPVKEDPVGKE